MSVIVLANPVAAICWVWKLKAATLCIINYIQYVCQNASKTRPWLGLPTLRWSKSIKTPHTFAILH